MKAPVQELYWMLYMGIPMVGLVHIAVGSFLSLQAYYGSTLVRWRGGRGRRGLCCASLGRYHRAG